VPYAPDDGDDTRGSEDCSEQLRARAVVVATIDEHEYAEEDETERKDSLYDSHVEVMIKLYFISRVILWGSYITHMTDNSVTLHRVLKTSPEKLFRAFKDPQVYASWIPPYGFLCTVHSFDFKEGGTYKMSFTNFGTGNSHSFGGSILEIRENEYIKYTDAFDDPNLPGVMTTTVELKKVSCGTELRIVQSGIPAVIPAEMCYLGWQESLEKLAKLVEPDIPDA
jgi:uncharacterized protein YndB with AHSA1/START domain